MKKSNPIIPRTSFIAATLALFVFTTMTASAAVEPIFERDAGADRETDGIFVFETVPSNSSTDVANGLSFALLDGSAHTSSGPISYLTDGPAQTNWDSCCGTDGETWFASDTGEVRIQVDLGASFPLGEINTYSWHRNARAPQLYKVYGAASPSNTTPDFAAAGFQDDTALASIGYTLIGMVNTGAEGQGGQVGVSFAGELGSFRYVVFDMIPAVGGTRATFFGEIDIVSTGPPEPSLPFIITEIEYDSEAQPDPTVTLTWRKSGAGSYVAYLSRDLSDWSEDLDDSITAEEDDERPEDTEHITVTFPLEGDRADALALFFRIEEG